MTTKEDLKDIRQVVVQYLEGMIYGQDDRLSRSVHLRQVSGIATHPIPPTSRTTLTLMPACWPASPMRSAHLGWFPRYQAYLRKKRPPTLILWGPEDGYMPAESARAYYRDLPNVELQLIDSAGHWLLETHFDDALSRVRAFLSRIHVGSSRSC